MSNEAKANEAPAPDQSIDAELLRDLVAELSDAAKRRIVKKYKKRVDGMRNSQTPGHAFWFPEHSAALQRVKSVIGV